MGEVTVRDAGPLRTTPIDRIAGHLWTISPFVRAWMRRPEEPPEVARWSAEIVPDAFHDDAFHRLDTPDTRETITLRGRYRARPEQETLVVLLHGLGGCAESFYLIDAAAEVERAGYAHLRVTMRGGELDGEDMYHAGLSSDLHAVLRSPELAGYRRIVLMGFSLGGHIALKSLTEDALDPRVACAVAVCPPLDLAPGVDHLDSPAIALYRAYLLRGLKRNYAALARAGRGPSALRDVAAVQTIRGYDALTVVPRFGFQDTEEYYRTQSVARRLDRIQRPALVVTAPCDPMIPAAITEPVIAQLPEHVTVRRVRQGGHVYMPPRVALGFDAPPRLIAQALAWADRHPTPAGQGRADARGMA